MEKNINLESEAVFVSGVPQNINLPEINVCKGSNTANKDKRVLIIKEDQIFNNILKKHFEQKDYKVDITSNGVEGMKKAIENTPNVIILDVNLPTLSGFMLTKRIKNDDTLKNIPILMVSPNTQEININKSRQLGINEFIPVPIQMDFFCDKVEGYIHDQGKLI
jgi:DNA-binding response OmpR family regulator